MLGASADAQLFDSLHVNTQFQVFTDFSSATDFVFNMGLQFQFANFQASSNQAYAQARKETIVRKIQACEIFYEYLSRRKLFDQMLETDSVSILKKRLEQIELAYLLIQIETLSGVSSTETLDGEEPDAVDAEKQQFSALREEDLQIAVLNYRMVMQKEVSKSTSFSLNMKAVSEKDYSYLMGGPGISYKPSASEAGTLDDRLQEVNMRKMILQHEVLLQELPVIRQAIEDARTQKNTLSRNYILGRIDEATLKQVTLSLEGMEAMYYTNTLKVLQIDSLFKIMRGEW